MSYKDIKTSINHLGPLSIVATRTPPSYVISEQGSWSCAEIAPIW